MRRRPPTRVHGFISLHAVIRIRSLTFSIWQRWTRVDAEGTDVDGAVVREWRRSRGWDVPEMARRLRTAAGDGALPAPVSLKRMINRWESGGLRTERYVLLYAAALGVSPGDLVSGPVRTGVSSLLPGVGGEDGEDPVRRREFGSAALGFLAAAPVPAGGTAR